MEPTNQIMTTSQPTSLLISLICVLKYQLNATWLLNDVSNLPEKIN